ncbi:MAG: type II secretion system F family protein [Alphaproteobacteria bacterium]|nr:type II secretion system F family protein [Alphaproteobacteria bacterium]
MIGLVAVKIGFGVSLTLFGIGGFMMRQVMRDQRATTRLHAVINGGTTRTVVDAKPKGEGRDAVRMLSGLGQGILKSGVVSGQTVTAVQKSLEGAGIRNRNAVGAFVAAKLMLAVGLPLMLFILLHRWDLDSLVRNMILAASGVGGLLAPDYFVRSLRKRYQKAIADGLPDTLDMLVMCAESGLSLEPAIQRVGAEIHNAHPAIANELMLTAGEFQISTDSHAVLDNLGERTGIPQVRRVVATLQQTMQYGTPLAEALRILSAEMRQEILTQFEEKAAKLPVLLTLPMILFILPTMFMIVGGPAVLQAMRIFSSK